jgi:hypothetical protein
MVVAAALAEIRVVRKLQVARPALAYTMFRFGLVVLVVAVVGVSHGKEAASLSTGTATTIASAATAYVTHFVGIRAKRLVLVLPW